MKGRWTLLVLMIGCAYGETFIRLSPTVVTQCGPGGSSGATVVWAFDGAGPVQVRVGAPNGTSLTGLTTPQGQTATGNWLTDGLVFVLTDAGSQEIARTTAVVRCSPQGEVLPQALATATYFPLQVGDEWVYNYNSRIGTANYLTRRITQAEVIAGITWFDILESIDGDQPALSQYRSDDAGRIYQLINNASQLWLDPTATPDPSAFLKITGKGGEVDAPAGKFQGRLDYTVTRGGLDLENGTFARGIGLVTNSHTLLEGSGGGFSAGMTLVYAKIDGHVVFASPATSLELSTDASSFDVTDKQAPNCAVPCYFVACGLGPGADPPGTYKPCFQARIRIGQTGSVTQSCDLDLLDSSNNSVFHVALSGTSDPETVLVRQVPLYTQTGQSAPVSFPPGSYQLRVKTADGKISTAPINLQ